MNQAPPLWETRPDQFSLSENEVHVWRAGLDLGEKRIQALRELLSPDERERADRFRFPVHRHRFIAGRGLLRILLAHYLSSAPENIRFSYGPHGKPALADETTGKGIRFNVAHSDGMALFAVARSREVGVDVENLNRELADDQISERFFSPTEAAALRALPVALRREAFFNCWTRKEAYLQATGKGLPLPLNQFDVSFTPGEPAKLLSVAGEADAALRWTLQELSPGSGFVAALAVAGCGWRVRCCDWPAGSEAGNSCSPFN